MYRKVLIAVLMLGISTMGFAQKEKQYGTPKKLVEDVAKSRSNGLLEKMKSSLKTKNIKLEKEIRKQIKHVAGKQFLYQEDKVESNLYQKSKKKNNKKSDKRKSYTLEEVFGRLCDSENMPTNLKAESLNIKIDKMDYPYKRGKKVDSLRVHVPVVFQTHTTAKGSDVRDSVNSTWEIKFNKEPKRVEEKTKSGKLKKKRQKGEYVYVCKQEPKWLSCKVTSIDFLTSEEKAMKTAAKKAVVDWYKHLPQRLDRQYSEQAKTGGVKPKEISSNDFKLTKKQGRSFTATFAPEIKVEVDPYKLKFISEEDSSVYTNTETYIVLAPTFEILVDNTFKTAKVVSVSYEEKSPIKPVSDSAKVARRNVANRVIDEFLKQLSAYIPSREVEQQESVKNMFDAKSSDIEVSFLSKNGSETRKIDSVKEYLTLLRGLALNFTVVKVDADSNWEHVIYTVDQKYQSKTYSDHTQKLIHLTYDSSRNTYLVSKIKVIPGTTKAVE